jgi:hypothetical protein
MPFSKNFPKNVEGSSYTRWEEVFLTETEDSEEKKKCREENIQLMSECINDAREIILKQEMKNFDPNVIEVAKSLFDKRASHEIYFKEARAKKKFDAQKSK